MQLCNSNLQPDSQEFYYHLGLTSEAIDVKATFGDTKFVCMGGSQRRMERLAVELSHSLGMQCPAGQALVNMIPDTDRYVMYKVGPVICLNHGMGMPSISIALHEITKLLTKASCTNVIFFRIGTSGGVGVSPGTVCISERCVDTQLRPFHELHILGRTVQRAANFDAELTQELLQLAEQQQKPRIPVVCGTTLCANDFYEEQGRTDGAICEHSEEDKQKFLRNAFAAGVRNIEMESLAFAAFTHKLNLRAACMAIALLDRFKGDSVTHSHAQIKEWEQNIVKILAAFIIRRISNSAK